MIGNSTTATIRNCGIAGIAVILNGSICAPSLIGGSPKLEHIKLPPGFEISVLAENVKNARAMCWGAAGTLFVGSRSAGIVHALRDEDGDGSFEARYIVARDINMPAGVAFKDGDLYVSALDRILVLRDIERRLADPPKPEVAVGGYPSDKHHGWKFIAFGPDGQLYVPVGAPCNVCQRSEEIFSTITRVAPGGGEEQIVAHGVRNTVGFDWHPVTGELWFTDNGRDWMGDDMPPCELNRLKTVGSHFGFPHCHGRDIPDPDHLAGRDCSEFEPPVLEIQAHSAPLGMRFYRGTQFPERYRNAVFIANHGSWNRSTPVGYNVIVAFPQEDGTVTNEVFAEGWLSGSKASGRPVDVLEMPDGSLLVSDDAADMIYRITYKVR